MVVICGDKICHLYPCSMKICCRNKEQLVSISDNQNVLANRWHGLEGSSGSTTCIGKRMSKEMYCEVLTDPLPGLLITLFVSALILVYRIR
jgi:hypothetical protein